jgi:hypothetical protein
MAANDKISFVIEDDAPGGAPLLTIPGGIGLYRHKTAAKLEAADGAGLTAEIRFEKCFVRLGAQGDSFLALLLPGSPESESFDLGVRWNSDRGISLIGSGSLEITLPIRARLPGVTLQALRIIVRPAPADSGFAVELSTDVQADLLGVIQVGIERIGVTADVFAAGAAPAGSAPAGPVAVRVQFKPPSGASLSLKLAGIIEGGGALSIDPAKGQYSGILSVNLFGIGITAIGIINTKPSFSLLTVLTANFGPVGLDISFGFTINKVGGIFGLHRIADTDAVRQGIRTNAISSALFPSDPIANAPRVISDLARFFPPLQDHVLIGPMIELGWGKPTGMFSLALGVVIQVPDPNLIILGIFRVLVPPGLESPPLRIQVNFAGGIDFARQMLWFDASLFDSRLITYTLEGDMAARLRWGSNATFAVTVGGFHPKYVPAADLGIPALRRVAINLLPTANSPKLRIESYYAATSNTLQHGARLEVEATIVGFGLRGHLGYDVLVQLSPLYFEAAFSGEVSIIAFDEDFMSLRLDLTLAGPTPWRVDGEASFKFIIKRVRIPVRATFGSDQAPALPEADVAKAFEDQLNAAPNWTATLPGQSELLVHLRPHLVSNKDEVLAHPSATVRFEQNAIPLAVEIQRFGAARPKAEKFFDTVSMQAQVAGGGPPKALPSNPTEGEFAPSQFFELSLEQKLSAPSFEHRKSGLQARGGDLVAFGTPVPRVFTYEDKLNDPDAIVSPVVIAIRFLSEVDAVLALSALDGSALGRSPILRERETAKVPADAIKIKPADFRVVDSFTMQAVEGIGSASTRTDADRMLEQAVMERPGFAGRLVVVSAAEVG